MSIKVIFHNFQTGDEGEIIINSELYNFEFMELEEELKSHEDCILITEVH